MPAKVTEHATEYREIDRWADGVGWLAHPEEIMQRASHALATDEGVWLTDPVDADGIDDLVAESVGGASYQCVGDERLGVMLMRRLTPPTEALANARRRFPRGLLQHGTEQLRTMAAAVRT